MNKPILTISLGIAVVLALNSCMGSAGYYRVDLAQIETARIVTQPFVAEENEKSKLQVRGGFQVGPEQMSKVGSSSYTDSDMDGSISFLAGDSNMQITLGSYGADLAILLGSSTMKLQFSGNLQRVGGEWLGNVMMGPRWEGNSDGMTLGASFLLGLQRSPGSLTLTGLVVDSSASWDGSLVVLDTSTTSDTGTDEIFAPALSLAIGLGYDLGKATPYVLLDLSMRMAQDQTVPSYVVSYPTETVEFRSKINLSEHWDGLVGAAWQTVGGTSAGTWSVRGDMQYHL